MPQTWGSAFGAGFTYTAGQQYINRPFLGRGADGKQKTELEAPFFSQIQVVLVLGWRRR